MNRNEKVANSIKELAAEFLNQEASHVSLLTVTEARCSADLKRATIFISVLPAAKEAAAWAFVRRNLGKLREFLKEKLPIKNIPYLEVKIDLGEKNRQKIDELLRNG